MSETSVYNIGDSYSAVQVSGCAVLPNNVFINIPNVLLDTGAVTANYMSTKFYNQHVAEFAHCTSQVKRHVKLGDSATLKPIDKTVVLVVKFPQPCYDSKGGTAPIEHTCSIVCDVFDTGHDMIVGLPTILGDLFPYFIGVMHCARDKLYEESLLNALSVRTRDVFVSSCSDVYSLDCIDDIVTDMSPGESRNPFPDKISEAIEDMDTPHPVIFEHALHYMEMSPEKAETEFHTQIPEHVDKAFMAACPGLLKLLIEKGVLVFVPQNWNGINGIPELELNWKGDPPRMKPQPRPINPKLFATCRTEVMRLMQYHLEKSDSEVASSLVVAPKATTPFVRFCGNYPKINQWIEVGHYPIPHVQRSLEKIIRYRVFIDLDMVNSFHQFRLAYKTSQRLSIVTPWGQFRPKFMPEGVGPASGILQSTMSEIFADFEEWAIVLFDNFLLLADSYEDAYIKLEKFLDRCIERNIFLKFAKSWLGVDTVMFFGYECRYGSYKLSDKRTQSILDIPMPATTKQVQSFLGASIFFKPFVPHYAALAGQTQRHDT